MINALNIAIGGLTQASHKVAGAANNIADPAKIDDLARHVADLKVGELTFKANTAVIRTVDGMSEELLRVFDEEV